MLLTTLASSKTTLDKSPTNLSSIVFTCQQTVSGADQTILMTGDSCGDILTLTVPNKHRWDIMKIMHHGSSRNSILSTGTKDYVEAIKAFFDTYSAVKYVISADTFCGTPNPDLVSLFPFLTVHAHHGPYFAVDPHWPRQISGRRKSQNTHTPLSHQWVHPYLVSSLQLRAIMLTHSGGRPFGSSLQQALALAR